MKRKLESDEELDAEVGNADEFRDQLLEEDEFVRVIKLDGKQPNIALPPDWIGMYHKSGGIIYLNRKTRVCCWARPYHIGQASVRKHDVPTAAIPCLHQIMALKKNKKRSNENQKLLDIHDGIIGHHSGSLGNHFGDHDSHNGNQNSDGGYHGNSDGSSDGNNGNQVISCNNVDGRRSNDGSQSDDVGNLSGNMVDGNPKTMHGNQSTSNGNNGGTSSKTGDCSPGITDKTSELVSTDKNQDSVSNDWTASNKTIKSTVKLAQNSTMAPHQSNDIIAVNKTKTIENSDSDSGNVSENAESLELEMSSVQEIRDYLGKLWEFRDILKAHERRLLLTDTSEMSQDATQEYKSTKMLKTIPYLVHGVNAKSKNNEKVVINPAGKSARSLLHEYCIKVHDVKPEYTTEESGISKTPFLAIAYVNGMKYGTGMAASKKQAKHCAAQKTLEILMPKDSFQKLMDVDANVKLFDDIPIEDPNIYELTSKLGLLSPYQILNECIKRNQGLLKCEVKFELNHGPDKQLFYTMECGKHKATGPCRNKKLGREFASQTVLRKLHPQLENWGSILRMYVDDHTAQEFTKPEPPASVTPSNVNKELLSDLKHEMWKCMKKKTKASTGFVTNIDI